MDKQSVQPLITIITSTFNAGKELEITAASIRGQTYKNIQWIIADGGSRQETIDIIKANQDIVSDWFSERDKGIYDAWNKAIPLVKGSWVQFLGAGDEVASSTVYEELASVLCCAHPTHDIVYGKLQFLSERDRTPVEVVGEPWDLMKEKWLGRRPVLPVHPEVFHHKSILSGSSTFDSRFQIAGDYHFLLKHILRKSPLFVPVIIDKMPLGGTSGKISSAWTVYRETSRLIEDLSIHPPLMHSLKEFLKAITKTALSTFLPRGALHRIADTWRVCLGKPKRWTVS